MCAQRFAPAVAVIVEDLALAQALRFMLISEGFQAQVCQQLRDLQALELPAGRACLIVDERLEGLTGVTALKAIRASGIEAPAILIATATDPALHQTARTANAVVVEKPLVGDALLKAVRTLTRT